MAFLCGAPSEYAAVIRQRCRRQNLRFAANRLLSAFSFFARISMIVELVTPARSAAISAASMSAPNFAIAWSRAVCESMVAGFFEISLSMIDMAYLLRFEIDRGRSVSSHGG